MDHLADALEARLRAVATPERVVVSSHLFDGDRAEIRASAVLAALDLAVAEI